jgi:hypothetical protein
MTRWQRFRHALGFHGPNWQPQWHVGNVIVVCRVCGVYRMLAFGDASEIPSDRIASEE